jgi:transposase
MADRLGELGVTRVVMEATSDYWKGVFYLLEAHGLRSGWSMPAMSGICPGVPRPTR